MIAEVDAVFLEEMFESNFVLTEVEVLGYIFSTEKCYNVILTVPAALLK